MRNKGFTLVELLAVIVILAIIAMIAIPIVAKIVLKAAEDSDALSIEMYVNSINASLISTNTKTRLRDATCTITNNGNLDCNGVTVEVHVEKSVPESGTVIVKRMKVNNIVNLKLGDYYYNYDADKNIVASLEPAEEEVEEIVGPTIYSSLPSNTTLTIGDVLTDGVSDSSLLDTPMYLGHNLDSDSRITMHYICAYNQNESKELCLKADSNAHDDNARILKEMFSEENCVEDTYTNNGVHSFCECRFNQDAYGYSDSTGYIEIDVGNSYCTAMNVNNLNNGEAMCYWER